MRGRRDILDTKRLYSDTYTAYAEFHEKNMYRHDLRTPQLDLVKHYLADLRIADDATVVEVGCGLGHLHLAHPNWQGFEYADSAVALAKKIYGPTLNIVEADGRDLPLKSNSVDFLFSFDALEHIPEVERAFGEIVRTIKPGGAGYLHPAWNCRSWQVKKLEVRPYSELTLSARIGKFLIPLRDNVLFRLVCNLPGRVMRELRLLFGDKAIPLDYRPLEPDVARPQCRRRCLHLDGCPRRAELFRLARVGHAIASRFLEALLGARRRDPGAQAGLSRPALPLSIWSRGWPHNSRP